MSEREALNRIRDKYRRSSESWRSDRNYPTDYSRAWHDGFVTALAECSLLAAEGLDPEAFEADRERSRQASWATDQEWFDLTGCCGHCGNPAEDCVCTEDDPCGCGPHEQRTWPKPCPWCDGTGKQDPVGNQETQP